MYEDGCLQCGKPIIDGRAYCSDDCESLDATSPSISTASSTSPSPHLTFSMSASAADRDIPQLLPSALGGSPLNVYARYHKMNSPSNSYSGYRPSSTHPWSTFQDADDDPEHDPRSSLRDDFGYHESGGKPPSTSASPFLTPVISTGLSYARRPSSTNHHSTVPLLHRRSSSGASSPTRPVGIPQSAPSPLPLPPYPSSTDDEFSDNPEKDSTLRASQANGIPTKTFKKRNRASLPAYFSLLQLTSTTAPLGKSKHVSSTSTSSNAPMSSPSTIRTRDRSFSITATSTIAVTPTTVLANQIASTPRGRDRGRSRRKGQSSSSSSVHRSRSRRSSFHVHITSPSRPTCQHHHLTQKTKKIDSVEKVTDWVTSNIGGGAKRRPCSPFPGLSHRDDVDSEDDGSLEKMGAVSESDERRGRLRAHELDIAPNDARGAPGFGNGRSGLRDRERRGISIGLTPGMSLGVLEGEEMGE